MITGLLKQYILRIILIVIYVTVCVLYIVHIHAHTHTFFRERNCRPYPRMIQCEILCRLNLEINQFWRLGQKRSCGSHQTRLLFSLISSFLSYFLFSYFLFLSFLFLLPSFPFLPMSFVLNGNPMQQFHRDDPVGHMRI